MRVGINAKPIYIFLQNPKTLMKIISKNYFNHLTKNKNISSWIINKNFYYIYKRNTQRQAIKQKFTPSP